MDKDIVLIEWVDSKGLTNWEDIDGLESMPPVECLSVGFLLDENESYKTIALGMGGNQVLGRMTIPTGCIKSIKKLRARRAKPDRKAIAEWFAEHEFGDDLISLSEEHQEVCKDYADQILALIPDEQARVAEIIKLLDMLLSEPHEIEELEPALVRMVQALKKKELSENKD
ncbi:hypothetical protein LCGC14_2107850 [marine sediment metagenome]|uniref:Uncharacterized protein n=1 Tax=marine sediment metagenome TaxID=412755 RepID=A0A0F9E7Y0_9ZZZZ